MPDRDVGVVVVEPGQASRCGAVDSLLPVLSRGPLAATLLGTFGMSACGVWLSPAVGQRIPPYTQPPPTGYSVQGRAIRVVVRGNLASPRRMLVFGCIHGTECAGVPIARRLTTMTPPPDTAIWIVENLDPDGYANKTRPNARGVNLNRNFPWKWHRIGQRGSPDYAGPRVLSEPEARFAWALIEQVQPQITVWYHQHMNLVDLSGGSPLIERRYACLVGMKTRQLLRYDGSASTWQNHEFPGTTAFVVELPAGRLKASQGERHAKALVRLNVPGAPVGCP